MCENCNRGQSDIGYNINGYGPALDDLIRMVAAMPKRKTNEEILEEENSQIKNARIATIRTHHVTDNVTLNLTGDVNDRDVTTIIELLRKLDKIAPAPGKVEVFAPFGRPETDGSTTRVNKAGWLDMDWDTNLDRVLYLTKHAFIPQMADFLSKKNQGITDAFMPTGAHTPNLDYTLVHEWGHVVDVRAGMADTAELVEKRLSATTDALQYLTFVSSLSQYGRTAEPEAYAECFTEWFLSDAKTNNFAAKWYAKEYNWKMN